MIPWKHYRIPRFNVLLDYKEKPYLDCIACFDIETTSFFKIDGKWETPYTSTENKCRKAKDKLAICYIWQFSLNGTVVYGRTLSEFVTFLERLKKINPERLYIYVHFLSFEFHFLCSHIRFNEVFARKAHSVLYCRETAYNTEWRCSYMLTNMALEKLADNYNLPITKLSGYIDYTIPRLPQTQLTEKDMAYCETDVLVMHELIKQFVKKYGNIPNIPLTQTGEVRRVIKNEVLTDYKYKQRIRAMYPNLENYKLLTRAFMGGYTHANYLFTGEILHNVFSFDRASSYPSVMLTEMYPMSRFEKAECRLEKRNHYCYLVLIEMTNFRAKSAWNYISAHKTEQRLNVTIDNGRICAGERITMLCTDVDYDIIKENYDFEELNILECWRAIKGYLPLPFINYMLELYFNKTTLKGNAAKDDLYRKCKQFINALYGMCVTNTIRDELEFLDSFEWKLNRLNDEDISERLEKPQFLNFSWGVYITAYARRELWYLINRIGNDCIYSDTDSVKIINVEKHLPTITDYNKSMIERLERIAEVRGIDLKRMIPFVKNKRKGLCGYPLGVFEFETIYDDFKTYGAKKYAYNIKGKFGFTVSGCIKSYYDKKGVKQPTIKSMDDFNLTTKFPHGRKNMYYCNNQPLDAVLTDLQGHVCINTQVTGIASLNSTYTLNIAPSYEDFLTAYSGFSTHNKYSNPFRLHL